MMQNVDVVDSVEQEPLFDQPLKPAAALPNHHHQPLYATLAEYTLNSPRSFPIDPASRQPTSPRRPSSPLRSVDESHQQPGPSRGYTFPSPYTSPAKENMNMQHGSTAMSPSSSSTGMIRGPSSAGGSTMVQHRLSVSNRPRRPSPLLHEIQPPSRRLSTHQMLLLTPFGGPLPAGAMAGAGGMGMSRGSSSMGGASAPLTAPARMGSPSGQSSGWPRKDSASSSSSTASQSTVGMGREPPAAPPLGRFPPRARLSLGHAVASHSPLASTPMTTIFSQGSSEGSSSRDTSAQERERNQVYMSREEIGISAQAEAEGSMPAAPPITHTQRQLSAMVAMTRSNSLPVLTLRELDALKEKDGELGIQRGGDWAWVSRDTTEDAVLVPERPPLDTNNSTESASSAFVVTPHEQRDPFTGFNDPFAPQKDDPTAITPTAATHSYNGTYAPSATSSEYHYSPAAEARRMSDVPPSSTVSPGSRSGQRSVSDARRPSAPNMLRQSLGGMTPRNLQPNSAARSPPQASSSQVPHSFFQPSYQPLAPSDDQSPHGSPDVNPVATAPVKPTRPPILRYKSSPARYTGLGLNIVVRPTTGSRASANSGSGESAGSESRGGSLAEQSTPAGRGLPTLGHWAEVDFVDPLAATADLAATSHASALSMSRTPSSISPTAFVHRELPPITRGSVATAGLASTRSSIQSASSAPAGPPRTEFTVEQVTSRSHLTDFETTPSFKGRSRFESVDSAFPLMPGGLGGRLSVPFLRAGEGYAHAPSSFASGVVVNAELSEGFPRRGSMAMGTFTRLRKAMTPQSAVRALESEVDEMGVRVGETRPVDLGEGVPSGHWSERRGSWAEGWAQG